MQHSAIFKQASIGLVLASTSLIAMASSHLSELAQLNQSKQYGAAYRLSNDMLFLHEGETDFDLLYAEILLNTKHYPEALFVYERLRLTQPNDMAVILGMAKAYYNLGDNQKAYPLFKEVASKGDEKQQQVAQSFIGGLQSDGQRKAQGWYSLRVTYGYDSNVNAAGDDSGYQARGVGFVPLAPDDIKVDSRFIEGQIGAGFQLPIQATTFVAQFLAFKQLYEDAEAFDTDKIYAFANYIVPMGSYEWHFPFFFERYEIDSELFRRSSHISIELEKELDSQNQLGFFAGYASYRYKDDEAQTGPLRNVGLYWKHLFESSKLLTKLTPYFGDQNIDVDNFAYNARKFVSLDLNVRWLKYKTVKPYLFATYMYSKYNEPHPILLPTNQTRKDHYYYFSAGVELKLTDHISLVPEVVRTVNVSNFELYDYTRSLIQLSATYAS